MHSYGREISREGGQSEGRDGVGVEESLVLRWTQQLAAGLEVGSESFFFEDVPLVEFMYFVFTCMPGESYCRRLGFLLLRLCDIF